jgi:hypothetical protein
LVCFFPFLFHVSLVHFFSFSVDFPKKKRARRDVDDYESPYDDGDDDDDGEFISRVGWEGGGGKYIMNEGARVLFLISI